MQSFDVLSHKTDIHRSLLLEASAGTGKTFSIENIVSRLLCFDAHNSPLQLEQILVVTFTKEAAADLSQRIHAKLLSLHDLCQKSLCHASHPPFPDYFLPFCEQGEQAILEVKQRIERAIALFSNAQIFTIHAFCAHALQQEGRLFSLETPLSNREKRRLLRDFFRTELRPPFISQTQIDLLLQTKKGLEKFEEELLRLLDKNIPLQPGLSYANALAEWKEIKKTSPPVALLREEYQLRIPSYKKPPGTRTKQEIEQEMEHFFSYLSEPANEPSFTQFLRTGIPWLDVFAPTLCKKGKTPPLPQFPEWEKQLQHVWLPFWQRIASPPSMMAHIASAAQKHLLLYREKEERIEFDDLLIKMQEALDIPSFVNSLRDTYRAVIIDEFQDTDPRQWEIFDRLFTEKPTLLYLVGDPKQSIYAFRRADIYTYLIAAQRFPKENIYSLSTNYRSSAELVHALNALFSEDVAPGWIPLPKIGATLPYPPVLPSPEAAQQAFDDGKKGIHCWVIETQPNRMGRFPLIAIEEAYLLPAIAQEILSLHQKENLPFHSFCLIVRDRYQALRAIDFLEKYEIPCLSQRREKLFEHAVVDAVKEILEAVASPRDERKRQRAWLGPFFCVSIHDLIDLYAAVEAEKKVELLFSLQKTFLQKGVVALFHHLLHTEWKGKKIATHLWRHDEELATDLSLLIDHLSSFATKHQASLEEILNYLNDFARGIVEEAHTLSSLPDPSKEGVIIQTMHGSKGLEYEVVFALGVISPSPQKEEIFPVKEDEKTQLIPCTDPTSSIFQTHCHEVDAEKMRQWYVTLTRAKKRLYLPLVWTSYSTPPKAGTPSPTELFLSRFLLPPVTALETLYQRMTEWNPTATLAWLENTGRHQGISHEEIGNMPIVVSKKQKDPTPLPPLHQPPSPSLCFSPIEKRSFSRFAREHEQKTETIPIDPPKNFSIEKKTIHTLPTGADTGLYLHALLEHIPFHSYRYTESKSALLPFIQSQPLPPSFSGWEEVIAEHLHTLLQKEITLDDKTCSLAAISPNAIFRELEFLFCSSTEVYWNGVIDMAFEWQGKTYLLDWKTNWLGPTPSHYEKQALTQAMEQNQYTLQASLYAEAWKRYSSSTIPFGGVLYLFLRGIEPKGERGVFFIPHDAITPLPT